MNRNAAQAMRHWQQTDTARPRAERRAASGERRAASGSSPSWWAASHARLCLTLQITVPLNFDST